MNNSQNKPQLVYVTDIATTPEQLWEALTSETFTQDYWNGGQTQSDWQVGSPVEHTNDEGEVDWEGEVLESDPPRRLAYTCQTPGSEQAPPTRIVFDLQPNGATVKLTLTHDVLSAQGFMAMSLGWNVALSGLKRRLEEERSLLVTCRSCKDTRCLTKIIE